MDRLRDIVWLVLDSARYDSFVSARTPNISSIGRVERRYSYASWTAPSHYAFFSGLPPHENCRRRHASLQYREEVIRWSTRMGESEPTRIDYRRFLPHLSLAWFLKQCGYRCEARVSLPSLNPSTPLAAHFDHYELAKSHNDLPSIVESIEFREQPTFHFINTGETHYPYLMPGERASDVPHLAGLHGTFRDLNEFLARPLVAEEPWMDPRCMRSLHDRQIACIESVDRAIDGLFAKAPPHTWFMVTSDHGELFGEDGFFGHGPICHEKVFEVFFVEGERPE